MLFRLLLASMLVFSLAACSKGMKLRITPPQCTVDEKQPNCPSVPKEPSPMQEEGFFERKKY